MLDPFAVFNSVLYVFKKCHWHSGLVPAPKSANFILDCYFNNKEFNIQTERIFCALQVVVKVVALKIALHPSPCIDCIPWWCQTNTIMEGGEDLGRDGTNTGSKSINASCQSYHNIVMHHCLKVLEAWVFYMIINYKISQIQSYYHIVLEFFSTKNIMQLLSI